MKISDLIVTKEGFISQTKLAAASFHLLLFVSVAWITYIKQEFLVDMWTLYASFAVGHAVVDKATAQFKAFQDSKLAATTTPVATTTTHVEQTTVKTNP